MLQNIKKGLQVYIPIVSVRKVNQKTKDMFYAFNFNCLASGGNIYYNSKELRWINHHQEVELDL